jgi:aerobic-type carbon monoxide dehydrogenase small subunit (CoxS/CutS family)
MSKVVGLSKDTVRINILGKTYVVPKDKLLYVFQDLKLLRSRNKFCWNGECKNCTISFQPEPDSSFQITERACQTTAVEGLEVTNMPAEFYLTPPFSDPVT